MTPTAAGVSADEDLVAALWEARQTARPVAHDLPWGDLSAERAAAISRALHERVTGDAPAVWKLGAFEESARARLGLPGPLVAPVLPDRLHAGASHVVLRLADFVDPKLEAEIGVLSGPSGTTFMPCVEVADCRFAGWDTPALAAVADFGLQGAMIFGNPVSPQEVVQVRVRHDGEQVGSASASWDEACSRLALLPPGESTGVCTATGSITPMFPATRGLWEFDFSNLGRLSLALH